jgi:hypothetical protein
MRRAGPRVKMTDQLSKRSVSAPRDVSAWERSFSSCFLRAIQLREFLLDPRDLPIDSGDFSVESDNALSCLQALDQTGVVIDPLVTPHRESISSESSGGAASTARVPSWVRVSSS